MGKIRTTMIAAATAAALSVTLSACAPASPEQAAQQAAQGWVNAVMERKPADAAKFTCEEPTGSDGIISSKFDKSLYDLYTSGDSGMVIPKGGDWKVSGTKQAKDDKNHYVVTGTDEKAGTFSVTVRLKADTAPCIWSLDTSSANKS